MVRRARRAGGTSVAYFELAGKQFAVVSVPAGQALPDCLTRAEREVVRLLLAGASNAAIARAREVSIRTVANQVASSMKKLGVSSRAALIARFA